MRKSRLRPGHFYLQKRGHAVRYLYLLDEASAYYLTFDAHTGEFAWTHGDRGLSSFAVAMLRELTPVERGRLDLQGMREWWIAQENELWIMADFLRQV